MKIAATEALGVWPRAVRPSAAWCHERRGSMHDIYATRHEQARHQEQATLPVLRADAA